ncbi:hypothetical protein NT01CX_2227 [Clostridium novyi NT]|uniref:Uncharacterized protein n=1 Tax=Clostridium novyi (strain NT) TaxID=386415 RepID=A0Q0Z8_CLONN|nr:hypothetical protein NT01CX_2227 [Clostridium novyi NT]
MFMPSKLIIMLIKIKNGKIEGKTDVIKSLPPYKADFKDLSGDKTIFTMNNVQIKVIIKFTFNLKFLDLNSINIKIAITMNINSNEISITI